MKVASPESISGLNYLHSMIHNHRARSGQTPWLYGCPGWTGGCAGCSLILRLTWWFGFTSFVWCAKRKPTDWTLRKR